MIALLTGSRPGSTDGEVHHVTHTGHVQHELAHPSGPSVGPKIRAIQHQLGHQLKLTDINDAKGSLV